MLRRSCETSANGGLTGPCRGSRLLAIAGAAAYKPRPVGSGRSSGVEHNLAKVGVEGSNPFARSSTIDVYFCSFSETRSL